MKHRHNLSRRQKPPSAASTRFQNQSYVVDDRSNINHVISNRNSSKILCNIFLLIPFTIFTLIGSSSSSSSYYFTSAISPIRSSIGQHPIHIHHKSIQSSQRTLQTHHESKILFSIRGGEQSITSSSSEEGNNNEEVKDESISISDNLDVEDIISTNGMSSVGIQSEDHDTELSVPTTTNISKGASEVLDDGKMNDINNNHNYDGVTAIQEIQSKAIELRLKGKQLHDSGNFTKAAAVFRQASLDLDYALYLFLLNDGNHDTDSTNTLPSITITAKELNQDITSDSDVDTSHNSNNHNNNDNNDNDNNCKDVMDASSNTQKQQQIIINSLIEEYATCRLHQALCHLKNQDYVHCITSCTEVLLDGVENKFKNRNNATVTSTTSIVSKEESDEISSKLNDNDDNDSHDSEKVLGVKLSPISDSKDEYPTTTTLSFLLSTDSSQEPISPSSSSSSSSTLVNSKYNHQILRQKQKENKYTIQIPTAIRARAYHRRAKARLALGDQIGALEDSRSAAFLGDRNAVTFYGRLMREMANRNGRNSNDTADTIQESFNPLKIQSELSRSLSSSPSSTQSDSMQSLLSSLQSSSSSTSDLWKSLLSDSNNNDRFNKGGLQGSESSNNNFLGSSNIMNDLLGMMTGSPFLNMNDIGNNSGSQSNSLKKRSRKYKNGNSSSSTSSPMDSLAQSILSSLTKRIEDKDTQEMICNYLQSVHATQLQSMAAMAGVPLSDNSATKIVSMVNGITPKGIRKSLKITKRIIYVSKVLRKVFKVIGKYKHLLVLLVLISWIKSSILRPVVTYNKKGR